MQYEDLDIVTRLEIDFLVEEHKRIRKKIVEIAKKAGYHLSDRDFYVKFRKHIEKVEHDIYKTGGVRLISTAVEGDNFIKKNLAILEMIEKENCGGNLNVQ